MSLIRKKQVKLALGIAGASVLIFGLYKLWKHVSSDTATQKGKEEETQSEKDEQLSQEEDQQHIPFQQNIEDPHQEKMGNGLIDYIPYLKDIHYRIILCLMKGSCYQGVVSISFYLDILTDQNEEFRINYNGSGVKFLMVNGEKLHPRDVKYIDHYIKIPKQLLREQGKNNIEIIFENNYSFLNEGLSAYFSIDQNYKYSLRNQVIYTSNGYLEIQKIIPCINCLNQCKTQVETIHPNNFEVFSNNTKSLERFCSVTEYQKYPFLFDFSSNSLNKSIKLTTSSISSASGFFEHSNSSQYSTSNRKKSNTHFYLSQLPSIHNFFLFTSTMVQLTPNLTRSPSPLQESILFRYLCRHSESHRFARSINKLHAYILDILRRLSDQQPQKYLDKIDVIIVSDGASQGMFAPGIIMISEDSISQDLDIRSLYLIVRSLLGLLQLGRKENVVTLTQILALNQMVFNKFQEFRNYLYIKNQKYEKIRSILTSEDKKEFLKTYEGFFIKYYSKELKFVLKQNPVNSITFQLSNLMQSFKPTTAQEFWENLLSNYNFLSPLIIKPLLKVALRELGAPSDDRLRDQLKVCFSSSKYVLNFYSNEQISDNLSKFLECDVFGLKERITQLKVKQKFKDYITQKYEKYLPIKSNIEESQTIYNQFKKFNQIKNFHHLTLLKTEIKRVLCFGRNFIKPERCGAQCGVSGWKLLGRLKLYPMDEDYYNFLKNVDDIEQL